MLYSIYRDIKITQKLHFGHENVKILPSSTQHYDGCHYIMLLNLLTTQGLLILLHGIVSLQDAKSSDNWLKIQVRFLININLKVFKYLVCIHMISLRSILHSLIILSKKN